jgi:flagellar hook-associated protein 3 FlgL
MRVTANTFTDGLISQLNQLSTRQNRYQLQAATGQRVALPEDDPVAMRRVLSLQAEGKTSAQHQANIARQQELSNASLNAIKGIKTVSNRAREIAIAADSLKSPDELKLYGKEVTELIKQAVQAANTKNRGDYIFAGTRSDQPPFVVTVDGNSVVTGVTYQGNTEVAESEIISGVTLGVQSIGENTGGSGPRGLITDSRVGADFLNHLIELQNHLLAGDANSVATIDRVTLAKDEDNLLYHIGSNGAVQANLEATLSSLKQRSEDVQALVSREVDADFAQTLLHLNQTQTAYQAALQSAGKVLGTSLLDYLR